MFPDRARLLELLDPRLKDGTGALIHDSPVLPEVWVAFSVSPESPARILLTPAEGVGPQAVMLAIRRRLAMLPQAMARLYYHQSHVLAEITWPVFMTAVLPLTAWWSRRIERPLSDIAAAYALTGQIPADLVAAVAQPRQPSRRSTWSADLLHFVRVASLIRQLAINKDLPGALDEDFWRAAVAAFLSEWSRLRPSPTVDEILVERIGVNREVSRAIARSTKTIKVDAARRMFSVSCEDLCWAVVDSGIDATHPAFQRRKPKHASDSGGTDGLHTRIVGTYDFTRLTDILREAEDAPEDSRYRQIRPEAFDDLHWKLAAGQVLDWGLVEPFLRIPYDETYAPPEDEHGTHVAGILAADWRKNDEPGSGLADLTGVCPDLSLYDLRVLPRQGSGDEFTVLGALQFIRYLNARAQLMQIHGVNLSLSLRHEVRSYACGQSPVCEECERLVSSGVVVVAAAGNSGYSTSTAPELLEDYHGISITDPGNSENVITVGSTHREHPHTWGISFFSSRGPTADGRLKPDLVAPGEGIESVVPNGDSKRMNGTSMAAPHVSGVAAILMSYHPHLIGNPGLVKHVICRSATDLGRERTFQGAGLVDALRALQSL